MMQALGLLATLAAAASFRLAENRIPNSCSTQSGTAGRLPQAQTLMGTNVEEKQVI